MSVRILAGDYDGTRQTACLVDSVTETAFGPLFSSLREAEKFLEWLADEHRFDPREVDDQTLISLLGFFRSHECEAIKWTHPYCEPEK